MDEGALRDGLRDLERRIGKLEELAATVAEQARRTRWRRHAFEIVMVLAVLALGMGLRRGGEATAREDGRAGKVEMGVMRAEDAARRSEAAAARVESTTVRAEAAAQKAEQIFVKLQRE